MTGQDWLEKDFYAVLGVPKDRRRREIKKAYRKLARTLHPDHNPGDAAAETKFKEVGEAYAVLSDPEQRQQYDSLRAMAGGGARFAAGGRRRRGRGFEDLLRRHVRRRRPGRPACPLPAGRRRRRMPAGFEDILSRACSAAAAGRSASAAIRAAASGAPTSRPRPPCRSATPSRARRCRLCVERHGDDRADPTGRARRPEDPAARQGRARPRRRRARRPRRHRRRRAAPRVQPATATTCTSRCR